MSESTPSLAGAHHRPGGGFRNPWPGNEPRGFGDVFRWKVLDRFRTKLEPDPPFGSLPHRAPSIASPRNPPGEHAVTWIGHSTALLQLGALNVLTDPMFSDRASPFQWTGPRRFMPPALELESLPPIDIVLLSHNHYDHLDEHSVRRIAARWPEARWLCPLGLSALVRSFGARNVEERDWWERVDGPGFVATCTPARHFSARNVGDRGDTLWCGWTIATDEACVYFAGDTALHPEFATIGQRLGPFDLVMLPIGAYEPRWFMESVHMNPEDAIEAYRALVPSGSTPCLAIHWGTFRLTDEPVLEPPARFGRLWRAAGFPKEANWTFELGETRTLAMRPKA